MVHIITAKHLLTCDAQHTGFDDGAIAIDNGIIKAVGLASDVKKQYPDATITHYEHHILMPGLINAHTHLADNLFRGMVEDLPLEPWLQNIWKAEAAILTPETTYLGAISGLIENLSNGVTSCLDMFWFPESAAQAAEELKVNLATGGIIFSPPGMDKKTSDSRLNDAAEFYKNWKNSNYITPVINPHGTYTAETSLLKEAHDFAQSKNLRFHIHAAETKTEVSGIKAQYQKPVIEYLHHHNLLSESTVLAHGVHLNEKEIAYVADTKTHIIHCPISNMKLGSGFANIPYYLEKNINVGLGTDGAVSGNDLNIWLNLRMAASIHNGKAEQAGLMKINDLLHMVTLNGAKALGIADKTGSLEIGKQADFICLNIKDPAIMPLFDPKISVIWNMTAKNVSATYIQGELRFKEGQVLNFDYDSFYNKITALTPKIMAAL